MSEALTPLEKRFLDMLDDYCSLLPDGEHISGSREDVERAFLFVSNDALEDIIKRVGNISIEFLNIAQEATRGIGARGEGIRESWMSPAVDAAHKIQGFYDIAYEVFKSRIH